MSNVDVPVRNEAAVKFWRGAGYRDYVLTLEIMPTGLSFTGRFVRRV